MEHKTQKFTFCLRMTFFIILNDKKPGRPSVHCEVGLVISSSVSLKLAVLRSSCAGQIAFKLADSVAVNS